MRANDIKEEDLDAAAEDEDIFDEEAEEEEEEDDEHEDEEEEDEEDFKEEEEQLEDEEEDEDEQKAKRRRKRNGVAKGTQSTEVRIFLCSSFSLVLYLIPFIASLLLTNSLSLFLSSPICLLDRFGTQVAQCEFSSLRVTAKILSKIPTIK